MSDPRDAQIAALRAQLAALESAPDPEPAAPEPVPGLPAFMRQYPEPAPGPVLLKSASNEAPVLHPQGAASN